MEIKCPVSGETIRMPVLSNRTGSESYFLTEFEDLGIIGKGAFGIVKKCRNHLDDGLYAVKIVSASSIRFEDVLREVKALSGLHHPHVVRYHQIQLLLLARMMVIFTCLFPLSVFLKSLEGINFTHAINLIVCTQRWNASRAWLEENFSGVSDCSSDESLTEDSPLGFNFESQCLYIQLEFCPRPLEKFLKTSHNLDGQKVWKLFRQIMEGLAKVHVAGVAHLDLSSANVLLDAEDNIRISDFGLARLYDHQTKVDTMDDIFGLGLIFAELYKHLLTEHERSELLRNLREKRDFPEIWINEEHTQLMQTIPSLLAGESSSPSGMRQQQQQDKQEIQTLGDSEGKEPDLKKMRL
ncbi:eIF-2-alpha kinase GCN2-like isoform X2 [Cornus florida]|uniref:eIF-2-alpha kinase GCN2-like isoform X2 n=1 Tax=Cornus florida TaxID=4283 RepID=UPI00289AEC1A|nr:eIF-2-alpha kinase GCN2-like isoform X2 [Cornus florida]